MFMVFHAHVVIFLSVVQKSIFSRNEGKLVAHSISDVTRLVATEHVRNKNSLRESIHLKTVVVLIASIQSYYLIKLHFLQSFKPSGFIEKSGYTFNT